VKRISYWVLSTVSAVVLLFGFDASQRGATSTPAATISGGASGTKSGNSSGSDNGTSSGNSSGNRSGNGSGNRSGSTSTSTETVTGSVAQTQWGPVQVQLTVKNGSITKVSILQYPNGNGRDVELANYSLPILIQETIQSQSAHIDMVSGATYTSTGYIQSLQSALDQANL
jgi:uncharacterized protein with FMN-binding domain